MVRISGTLLLYDEAVTGSAHERLAFSRRETHVVDHGISRQQQWLEVVTGRQFFVLAC